MKIFSNHTPTQELYAAALAALAALPAGDVKDRLAGAVAGANLEILAREGCGEEIFQARELHCSDEVEIDDQPLVSQAEDGMWVQAWVFVPAKEDGEA